MNGQAATPSLAAQPSIIRHLRSSLIGAAAIALASGLAVAAAAAQEAIVQPGFAVVTGFAGVAATQAPDGADPFDYVGIDPGGASARVVDLTALGPQGVESAAPKPFTVAPSQVGQVFGVTLDDARDPDIYLAATSVYGLSIGVADASGQLKRVQRGEAGAQFVPGQFGPPELGGSPGSIWRIDGTTGEVSLFATVDTAATSVAALGGLAYDPRTRQVFAADRSTGIVYRYGLDGSPQGTYDHGVEGRPDAGLAPLPPTPTVPVDITSPSFDTTNPASWGFAPPARRVFALAVHADRLFYSIEQGPQVWSVQINPDGSVSGGARMEIEVPSLQDGVEIASITFDGQGRMYLAERGATTGDYSMYALANGGQSRVLRYLPDGPGHWQPAPQQYSVGMAPNYNNADGGVALSYGYTPQGDSSVIDTNACDATVWSTGGRLLDTGDPSAPPGTFPYVDGLQGNPTSLVQPQNMPPTASWFVDYDDKAGFPDFRGYMGAIATLPCAGEPAPPTASCPQGTYFDGSQCIIIPTCPPGTNYQHGQCVYPTCPPGYYVQNGQCLPPPVSCPPGSFYYKGQCYPISCPPDMIKQPNGQCTCAPGDVFYKGQCVPQQSCPPPLVKLPNGLCWCPLGLIFGNGACQPPPPPQCPPGKVFQNGQCVPQGCPPNKDLFNGQCVPKCPFGMIHKMPDGTCKPLTLCVKPNEVWNGKCVAPCPAGQVHTGPNGVCTPQIIIPPGILCLPGQDKWNGKCVPKCPPFQVHTPPNGVCKPQIIIPPGKLCLKPNEMFNGQCLPPCPPGQVHTQPNGVCKPQIIIPPGKLCLKPNEMFNGQCLPPCPPGQVHTQPNGVCKLSIVIPPGKLCLKPNEMFNGQCLPPCPPGQVHTPPNGVCKPQIIIPPGKLCLKPNEMFNGQCLPPCPPGQVHTQPNGDCKLSIVIPPGKLCLKPNAMFNGQCLPPCPPGQVHTQPNGDCKLSIVIPPGKLCLKPNEMFNGQCLPPCPKGQVHTQPNGDCKLSIVIPPGKLCLKPNAMFNGQCLPPCPKGQVHTQPNGVCKLSIFIPQIPKP